MFDRPGGVFVVVPAVWDVVRLFVAASTQWRHSPSGHRAGLDYAAVRATADALSIEWREVFPRLQVMEAEALNAEQEEATQETDVSRA